MEFHPYYTPPAREVQQSIREDQIHSLKQADCTSDSIRQLKQLVVNYDPSILRMVECLCIQFYIYPEERCNQSWWLLFWCKVQLLETVTTVIPAASGRHFQLMQDSFAVNCSLSTSSSLFQVVPVMHLFMCCWCLALEGLSSHLYVRI